MQKLPYANIQRCSPVSVGENKKSLLNLAPKDANSADNDKVLLITNYDPKDHCFPEMVRHIRQSSVEIKQQKRYSIRN